MDFDSRTNDLVDTSVSTASLDQQYFARSSPHTTDAPEKRLLFAVLLNAIIQLRSRDARDVIEAETWIRCNETTDSPFSFDNICEMLGIESNYLARGLLTWRNRPTHPEQPAPLRQIRASRTRVAPFPLPRRARLANGSRTPSINARPPNETEGVTEAVDAPERHGARAREED